MTRLEANTHDKLPKDTNLQEYYGKNLYDQIIHRFEQESKTQSIWNDVL